MGFSLNYGSDDPWAFPPRGISVPQARPDAPALRIEVIEGVEPLDAQLGIFPKKAVPDALHGPLFDQTEPMAAEVRAAGGDPAKVPSLQTYAVLDAAKVINMPELLERSGLEHRCLFQGTAYNELKNVAPWIVRLEEGNAFTRHLFTCSDASWHLCGREPGIYIRSRGTLEEVWRHLRKFTHVRDENGRSHFFRYWNHHLFQAWMAEGEWSPHVAGPFFGVGEKDLIERALVLDAGTCTAWQTTSNRQVMPGTNISIRVQQDGPIFRRALVRPLAVRLVPMLRQEHEQICSSYSPGGLQLVIERILMRLHAYGFRRHDILKELVVQDVYLGYPFENEDATGHLRVICRSNASQEDRYAWLCLRMQEMADVTT